MTWAVQWPRRGTAAVLAVLLPLLGALAIVGGGASAGPAEEIFADAHVDAISPGRVVPVRPAVPTPPQADRVDPPTTIIDTGPPRRAELPEIDLPAAPAGGGRNAAPVDLPALRGPPGDTAP